MANKDYYNILGVAKNSSPDQIKKAYRKLAHEHHPDKGGGKEAEAKFKEINEAYQVLSDPQKKIAYDQFGSSDFASGNSGGFSGFNTQGFDFSQGFGGGFGDIFDSIFGQAMSQLQVEVEITVAQAVLGETLHLQLDGKAIDLTIPPGTADGQSFILRGKGRAYRGGIGDLIITTRVRIPRHLSKEARELYEKLKHLER